MSCVSTRGDATVAFGDAILEGLAPDGGLYVPAKSIPFDVDATAGASYAGLARAILSRWVEPDLLDFESLYSFGAPIVELSGRGWTGIKILELFHGPTNSFKDYGARFLGPALGIALEARRRTGLVLVATSGDTGSAVADAMSDVPGLRVVLLFPHGKVSAVQERQLTARRPGVRAVAVEGTFDDCQRLVKEAFGTAAVPGLTSANSINIGRLLPQQVYYAWAAVHCDQPIDVVVPSGNLGNLAAGFLARMSGVPIGRFVAAHNRNDWFVRYLRGDRPVAVGSVQTLSNAMDVGAPSNFERLQYWCQGKALADLVTGYSISDDETCDVMRTLHQETGYLADPHTAVGLAAARRFRKESGSSLPTFVLATAHPAKFQDIVERATGVSPAIPPSLSAIDQTDYRLIGAELDSVLDIVREEHALLPSLD